MRDRHIEHANWTVPLTDPTELSNSNAKAHRGPHSNSTFPCVKKFLSLIFVTEPGLCSPTTSRCSSSDAMVVDANEPQKPQGLDTIAGRVVKQGCPCLDYLLSSLIVDVFSRKPRVVGTRKLWPRGSLR